MFHWHIVQFVSSNGNKFIDCSLVLGPMCKLLLIPVTESSTAQTYSFQFVTCHYYRLVLPGLADPDIYFGNCGTFTFLLGGEFGLSLSFYYLLPNLILPFFLLFDLTYLVGSIYYCVFIYLTTIHSIYGAVIDNKRVAI